MRYIVGAQIIVTDRNAPKNILQNLERNKQYKIMDIKPINEDGEIKGVNYKFVEIVRPNQTPSIITESFPDCAIADKTFDMLMGIKYTNPNDSTENNSSIQERLKSKRPDRNVMNKLNRRR